MGKLQTHIEIVSSTVRGLSSMSAESRRAIRDVLADHYVTVGITIINSLADLESLVAAPPDLVFLGMKYIPVDPTNIRGPERIWISEYLDKHGVAYTGSSHGAHRLELNKSLAKQRVFDSGFKTSPYYVIKRHQLDPVENVLSFPLFVKPTDRGGGVGVDSNSVVYDTAALDSKVQSIAFDHQADSLVEEYLPGREFSVAVLKHEDTGSLTAMPIELVTAADQRGVRVLGSAVKSSNTEVVSYVTDEAIRRSVCSLALDVFQALGARDYGRIDIRLDHSGEPHFMEANLLPSLIGGYGSFPKACALNIQLDYESMILTIVRLALSRQPNLGLDEAEEAVLELSMPTLELTA